jgi:hypothetical protein
MNLGEKDGSTTNEKDKGNYWSLSKLDKRREMFATTPFSLF